MHKRKIWIITLCALCAALVTWIAWGNTALEINEYTVSGSDLPPEFSGFRIAQVSDLHNAQMGENNEKLLAMLDHAQPDLIAITGDLIDSRRTDIQVALDFAAEAVKIAPCYYVTGNHESRIADYSALKEGLEVLGVTVLEDSYILLEHGGASVMLYGVLDPSFKVPENADQDLQVMEQTLSQFAFQDEAYTILLAHKPEMFPAYCASKIDLILSGHVHGGQFRLPYWGGLYTPGQGFFPEYDAGLYRDGDTHMIISRGIGNSIFPFRINNPPEIILVTLQAA